MTNTELLTRLYVLQTLVQGAAGGVSDGLAEVNLALADRLLTDTITPLKAEWDALLKEAMSA